MSGFYFNNLMCYLVGIEKKWEKTGLLYGLDGWDKLDMADKLERHYRKQQSGSIQLKADMAEYMRNAYLSGSVGIDFKEAGQ